jgi:DNA-binding winged helix-turn-helix (wHTH) protein
MTKPREKSESSESRGIKSRFGPFTIDAASRQLARGTVLVHLTPKAFDLLLLLVREAPRVVTKSELHGRLWPESFVTDASIAELVKEIRRALVDSDRAAPIVRTVHRIGYALGLEVETVSARPAMARHWLLVRGRRVGLREGENIIGRDPEAHVWLGEAGVSRRHARITIAGNEAQLEDLGSKNGTTIGRKKMKGPVALDDGDRIVFGAFTAVYCRSADGMSTETRPSTGAR